MKKVIIKNKLLLIYIITLVIFSLIFTILEYMGLSYNLLTTILLIINFILIFIYSYKCGLKEVNKGYKSGIKSGLKIISIFLITNIITFTPIRFKTIIYYLITLFICIIASIIGKNKQKNYSS